MVFQPVEQFIYSSHQTSITGFPTAYHPIATAAIPGLKMITIDGRHRQDHIAPLTARPQGLMPTPTQITVLADTEMALPIFYAGFHREMTQRIAIGTQTNIT